MIKISFAHINATNIEAALHRLSNMPLSSLKASYAVTKIKRKVLDAIKDRRVRYTEMITECAEKDEKGEMVRGPDGMPVIPEANREKLAEKTKEILGGELTIDWRPLDYSEIMGCQLTPNELEALAPVVTGLEEALSEEQKKEA